MPRSCPQKPRGRDHNREGRRSLRRWRQYLGIHQNRTRYRPEAAPLLNKASPIYKDYRWIALRSFHDTKAKLFLIRCTIQVCTMVCANTDLMTSGKHLIPLTMAIRIPFMNMQPNQPSSSSRTRWLCGSSPCSFPGMLRTRPPVLLPRPIYCAAQCYFETHLN